MTTCKSATALGGEPRAAQDTTNTLAGARSVTPASVVDNPLLLALFGDLPEGAPPWFHLWRQAGHVTQWCRTPEEATAWAHGNPVDLYVGPALAARPGGSRQRIVGKATSGNRSPVAAGLVALVGDIDIAGPGHTDEKDYPPDIDAALAIVAALPLPPTFVIHSGGGLHLWWVLREAWVFDTDGEREQAHEILRGWQGTIAATARRLGYEVDSVPDIARVLRVPGTHNGKLAHNLRPVTILQEAPARRYNPQDFAPFFPQDVPDATPEAQPIDVPDIALPCGADADAMMPRFKAALARDATLAATWARTRTNLNDSTPSGYDQALASGLACRHGWGGPELAWALRYSRNAHKGDRRVGHDYIARTVGNALASARKTALRVPIALLGAVPPTALRLWATLALAERTGAQPTQRQLAEEIGVDARQVRRLLRALEKVGAVVTEQAGNGEPARYTCIALPGAQGRVPIALMHDVSPEALAIALAIGEATRKNGPQVTQGEIGAWAGVTDRTVRKHLPELEASGWLAVEYTGFREALRYTPHTQITRPEENVRPASEATARQEDIGARHDEQPGHILPPIGVESHAVPVVPLLLTEDLAPQAVSRNTPPAGLQRVAAPCLSRARPVRGCETPLASRRSASGPGRARSASATSTGGA